MAELKHQIKFFYKYLFGTDKSGQSDVLLRYFRLSRLSGVGFSMIISIIGILILIQMFQTIGLSNSQHLIFSSTTFKTIKIACLQAFLSTLLSLLIGMVCARALYRRGNNWLTVFFLSTSFIALVVPTTIAALGIVAVWGRTGILGSIGLFGGNPFGLWMVVLAHVFFNAPLVLRVAYSALMSRPTYFWKIASQNNLTTWQILK